MGTAVESEKTKRKILAALNAYGPMSIKRIALSIGLTVSVVHSHKGELLRGEYIAEQDLGEKMKGTGKDRYIYRALKEDYRSVSSADEKLANPIAFYNPFRKNAVVHQGVNL
jgi:predicted ArsR family transcriptional regulator